MSERLPRVALALTLVSGVAELPPLVVRSVWFDPAMSYGWQMPGQVHYAAGEWRRSSY